MCTVPMKVRNQSALALALLLAFVLLRLLLVTRTAATSPVMAALLPRLEDGVTYKQSHQQYSSHYRHEHLGGAHTRSAMRVAAVLRQIRSGSTFGTEDHCGSSTISFEFDWVMRMST